MPTLSPAVSPTVSIGPRTPRYIDATDGNAVERLDGDGSVATAVSTPNPGLNRTFSSETYRSGISRVLSQLPNPERDNAEGPQHVPEGPTAGKPQLKKYSYGFFSPEMAMFRGIVIKILGMTVVLTTLVMWLCAPVYWGSLWKSNHYTDKLSVRIVDMDGGPIGQAVTEFLLPRKHDLGYFVTPADHFANVAAIEHDVVQEGSWAAIVINAGASDAVAAARASGDSSYDGRSAISFIYAQARNELATGSYLVPLGSAALAQITEQLSAKSVAEFLTANSGNATAIAAVARAPVTLTTPISYSLVNLRPYNQPVATAITLVGLIYMLIFSFIMTMSNNACREIIAPYLRTRSYLAYRILAPLALYFPISFLFSMINLPFKVHFDAHFTYAGGFFLWWFILYLGMASVGFATEFAITILGPKFVSFFLIPLIIANVSGVSVPHELQPWIFRYSVGMPFYNCSRAVRTIIFNTKNDIGLNCGILIAWLAVSMITIPLVTWLYRRNAVNEYRRENRGVISEGPAPSDGKLA